MIELAIKRASADERVLGWSWDYKCLYHPAKPGARGAFPVTVMDHY